MLFDQVKFVTLNLTFSFGSSLTEIVHGRRNGLGSMTCNRRRTSALNRKHGVFDESTMLATSSLTNQDTADMEAQSCLRQALAFRGGKEQVVSSRPMVLLWTKRHCKEALPSGNCNSPEVDQC